ncbi:MAG: hypothetical protein KGI57_07120 [Hyphomicrobiales bacterium]|nr:hypothetical protein [Hyphomicrobiales bacterium]MDE2017458.1 hypothetical protein [Hyphomicrobiales bacterium]
MNEATQRALPIAGGFPTSHAAEDFVVGPTNRAAVAALRDWPKAGEGGLVALSGPAGAGKTHLARVWAERVGARIAEPAALLDEPPMRLVETGALVLDPLDAPTDAAGETALFHALEAVRAAGAAALLVSRRPPGALAVVTPDLASRLRLARPLAIEAHDEELMRRALVKLFADRQLTVEAGVVDWLAARLGRAPDAARRLVVALDEEALARGRRVTRALADSVWRAQDAERRDHTDD